MCVCVHAGRGAGAGAASTNRGGEVDPHKVYVGGLPYHWVRSCKVAFAMVDWLYIQLVDQNQRMWSCSPMNVKGERMILFA